MTLMNVEHAMIYLSIRSKPSTHFLFVVILAEIVSVSVAFVERPRFLALLSAFISISKLLLDLKLCECTTQGWTTDTRSEPIRGGMSPTHRTTATTQKSGIQIRRPRELIRENLFGAGDSVRTHFEWTWDGGAVMPTGIQIKMLL